MDIIAQSKTPKSSYTLGPLELCICGALATMAGDFAMHPIDTIKIIQQSSETALSFLGAAGKIFSASGVKGFYQGVAPYLVSDGISGSIKFATFEISRNLMQKRIPQKFFGVNEFFCAAISMLTSSITLVPGEVLKIRMQSGLMKNIFDGVSQIWKSGNLYFLYFLYYFLYFIFFIFIFLIR